MGAASGEGGLRRAEAAHTLVLMRHGESTANLDGSFAGWLDVPLTATGIEQARTAGRTLLRAGFGFDVCYTSVLKRAIQTVWHCLDMMDMTWLPVAHSWRLDERHYGVLQGLNKAETENAFGKEQVGLWRRDYDTRPPSMSPAARVRMHHDRRYATLGPQQVPDSESMRDTADRLLPLWRDTIAPGVASGKRTLIVTHGTTLRALAALIGGLSEPEAAQAEVPNAVPLVYELDAGLHPGRMYYSG